MPNELHFYTKYSKEKVKISDKPLASGGEGAIYAIASPRSYHHLVAKIYYPEKRTSEREAKMQYLMQHPPITFQEGQPPSIGWVQDLIYREGRFLGILLLRIEGKKLTKLTLSKLPRRADKAWHRFALQDTNSLKLRLRTCFNLAVVLYQIHESGQYVLVDLKPDNVLMQPNGLLAIVDMDSVEVIEDGKALFAAPVATPEYTPPEHYTSPRTVIEETWDRFSLGVIFYQLLLGLHPFAASCHAPYDNLVSIHDKIQQHLYVHNSEKKEFFKVIPPPHKKYETLPIEVQQLFYDCFERGAHTPDLRPSALDWCSTLAELLDLPFKGMPYYNLPHKKLPKVDFQPSKLHFEPSIFINHLDINLNYTPFTIPPIDLERLDTLNIDSSISTSPAMVVPFEQKKLWDLMEITYKEYLKTHRNTLLIGISLLIPSIMLSILVPSFWIIGIILLLFVFPKLMLRTNKTIVYSIGKKILPASIDEIPSNHNNLLASNHRLRSVIQNLNTKRETLTDHFNLLTIESKKNVEQHLEKVADNEKYLSTIRQKISAQKALFDAISQFNNWTKQTKAQLTATRSEELKSYAHLYNVFSKQFLVQFQKKKAEIQDVFQDFKDKRFKLKKPIALQKNKLSTMTIKNKNIKQQLLLDYQEALEANRVDYKKQLDAYRAINQQLSPTETQVLRQKKVLQNELKSQLKYNKRKQQSALKRAKKKLGKNFQIYLKQYLDLLYNSGDATELHFAHNRIQSKFRLFQEEISKLNLDKELEQEFSNLFITKVDSKRVVIPQPNASNLSQLEDQQKSMVEEWKLIEKELQKLQNKVVQLKSESIDFNDNTFLTHWIKETKKTITTIEASENAYHQFQLFFYNNSQIAAINKELKTYIQETKEKQDLENNYSKKILQLDKKALLSEEREQLNRDLEIYQQNLSIEEKEKEEELTLIYQQELVKLEEKWTVEIQSIEKQVQEKTEVLAQFELDFQSFQDTIETTVLDAELDYPRALERTRSKFDAIYKEHKTTYDEKLRSVQEHYELLKKNHLDLVSEIEIHSTQDLENIKYLSTYSKNIDQLQEIKNELKTLSIEIADTEKNILKEEEEKIKIDTLIQWQKNYSTKTYIKDLLLNKVDQFKKEEDKKA